MRFGFFFRLGKIPPFCHTVFLLFMSLNSHDIWFIKLKLSLQWLHCFIPFIWETSDCTYMKIYLLNFKFLYTKLTYSAARSIMYLGLHLFPEIVKGWGNLATIFKLKFLNLVNVLLIIDLKQSCNIIKDDNK